MWIAFSVLPLLLALSLLGTLIVIDLKHWLLPNKFVLPFGLCGLAFHVLSAFTFLPATDMVWGALTGFGILYLIRLAAQRFYGPNALGLGDVKLMTAAGIWLGPYYILLALTAGAIAGLIHGLAIAFLTWIRTRKSVNLATLSLPAGPGFIFGIVLAGGAMLQKYPLLLYHLIF